jgi:hypothetical protein
MMPYRAVALWPAVLLLLPGCLSVPEVADGKPAPHLRCAVADSRITDLGYYNGKVVLIDFWRTG